MRKLTLIFAVLLLSAGTAFSQAGVGIKGGMNFATLNNVDDIDSRTGFHFGVFGQIPLSKNIALQPEALISTQGAKLDIGDVNLNYIQVPILLRLTIIKILNIHFGPQFGFNTKAELGDSDIKEFVKGTDFSAAVGAGVNLPFRLEAGLRYNIGISDISDGGIEFADAQNRNFQLYAAWRFLGSGSY